MKRARELVDGTLKVIIRRRQEPCVWVKRDGTRALLRPTPCCGAMMAELLAGDLCWCGKSVDPRAWAGQAARTEDHLARMYGHVRYHH